MSNLRNRRSSANFILDVQQWAKSLLLQGFWRGHGNLPLRPTCALGIWRRHMTVFIVGSWWGYSGNVGKWGCCYEPSYPYTTRVRIVSVFLGKSQTCWQYSGHCTGQCTNTIVCLPGQLLLRHTGEEGVDLEGKALNLPVNLYSNPNLWTLEITYEFFLW